MVGRAVLAIEVSSADMKTATIKVPTAKRNLGPRRPSSGIVMLKGPRIV
jgi:hypothetical protein